MLEFFLIFVVTVTGVIFDVRYKKIPNLLTFPSMCIGIIFNSISSGMNGAMYSIGGLVLGTAFFTVPWLIGVMGAGDAKLVGAIGAFVGPKGIFIISLLTALGGGIYALFLLLIYRTETKGVLRDIKNTFVIFVLSKKLEIGSEKEQQGRPKLCYGVAIAIGTLAYMVMEMTGYRFL